ncbi:MAG: hypothetical protein FJY26_01585 [Betaproteobacteria bacterium]|nr:hypothetical protein [Betaproteobacteria bacterium]
MTFALWLAVGASAVAWLMPWLGPRPQSDTRGATAVPAQPTVAPARWSVLGNSVAASADAATATVQESRIRLVGVAGPVRASGQGVALLSLDGQAARAFRPGDPVDGSRVVLEVTGHAVTIGPPGGPPSVSLQAPLLPPPATGRPAGAPPP